MLRNFKNLYLSANLIETLNVNVLGQVKFRLRPSFFQIIVRTEYHQILVYLTPALFFRVNLDIAWK